MYAGSLGADALAAAAIGFTVLSSALRHCHACQDACLKNRPALLKRLDCPAALQPAMVLLAGSGQRAGHPGQPGLWRCRPRWRHQLGHHSRYCHVTVWGALVHPRTCCITMLGAGYVGALDTRFKISIGDLRNSSCGRACRCQWHTHCTMANTLQYTSFSRKRQWRRCDNCQGLNCTDACLVITCCTSGVCSNLPLHISRWALTLVDFLRTACRGVHSRHDPRAAAIHPQLRDYEGAAKPAALLRL